MLRRNLLQASTWRSRSVCLFCAARTSFNPSQLRPFADTSPAPAPPPPPPPPPPKRSKATRRRAKIKAKLKKPATITKYIARTHAHQPLVALDRANAEKPTKSASSPKKNAKDVVKELPEQLTLKEALLGKRDGEKHGEKHVEKRKKKTRTKEVLPIEVLDAKDLNFEPVPHDIPPVPMLSYGLDRVLFNPGVYRLQDPRSRIYNFDPYLEKIMPVHEFDFDALSEYKTSSKDQTLLDLTKSLGTKFTGSTSSMSSVLQHFHYLLSSFRDLNHEMLSRKFPEPSKRFSKITLGPDAIFLRYKDGIYAIDADKSYDTPNIMSWLGHSLEKLLTTERSEFELFRRSNPGEAPAEDNSSRCYHYSKLGNVLMRSQLDAQDPRLPGTGVFDLKTRAVVSIRMNHKEYEKGSGYQLRFAQGEWESYEREFYDMTRATLLKYSLQVRMGRMDGIFLAYHNIERIFGFQYLPLPEMDRVIHGQEDTTLGDQEFRLSVGLLDEILDKATTEFPETSIRMHFEARDTKTRFMYIFAEPVTEEVADEIQGTGNAAQKEFARTVVGLERDNPEVQAAWHNIQDEVDEQVDVDKNGNSSAETPKAQAEETIDGEVERKDDVANSTEEESTKTGDGSTQTSATEVSAMESTASEESAAGETATKEAVEAPLMGWTLTVRNKVNDTYVDRAQNITAQDDWKIEYHIQEIPVGSRRRLYNALKQRRRGLIGLDDEEINKSLANYRSLIQRFSNRGREWRNQQDKVDEEKGVQVYRPMGPGSDKVDAVSVGNGVKME